MIIFGTEQLKSVTKNELINLFDYLTREGYNFDPVRMVWKDRTHPKPDTYNYIGLLCNEWGGVIVHIPVKAWNSLMKGVPRGDFHLYDVLDEELCGKTIDKETGFDGKVKAVPTIIWKKI